MQRILFGFFDVSFYFLFLGLQWNQGARLISSVASPVDLYTAGAIPCHGMASGETDAKVGLDIVPL